MADTIGAATIVSYGSAALADTPTYTAIGAITGVGIPGAEADDIDVTDSDALTASWVRKFVKGLADGGDITVEINFDITAYAALYALVVAASSAPYAIKVDIPEEGEITFDGYIKGIEGDAPQDDKITGTLTIKVGSVATFTPDA